MMSEVLLSIDLSTSCTGWSIFNMEDGTLVTYGVIKGKTRKDSSQYRMILRRLEYMATCVLNLIENYKPTHIVIEEIAGSKNRMGQKTLDMCHGILWKYIDQYLDIVEYYDVSGSDSWRYDLGLRLSEQDKIHNKEAKKINKTLSPHTEQIHIYNWKDVSCRYANQTYNLGLDPIQNKTDADIGDSVAMGSAYLKVRRIRNPKC